MHAARARLAVCMRGPPDRLMASSPPRRKQAQGVAGMRAASLSVQCHALCVLLMYGVSYVKHGYGVHE